MAIGFTATNVLTKVVPDRSLTNTATPNVRTAQFGDGYQQRAVVGINNITEEYTLSFANRNKAAADDIVAFFAAKNGVSAFNFTIPDTNSTTATVGRTTGGNTTNSNTITLNANNLDISPGAVLTDSGGQVVVPSGATTITTTGVSGAVVTLNHPQSIVNGTDITFTNQNEKTIKVVCSDWTLSYNARDYYTIQTTFKRVYET